jgi:hypothetical protein
MRIPSFALALRVELGMAKPRFGSSKDESDAGRDDQQVYSEQKLPIGKPLEDAQSQPRAEQSSGNESERLPSVSGVDAPSAGAML